MKRANRIWWWGLVLLLLVFPATGQEMPPHPSLLDKIARGEVQLPGFMVNTALRAQGMPNQPEKAPASLTGTLHALVVLVKFNGKVNTAPASFFDNLTFPQPVTYPSVRDFYQKVSYGKVDIITLNLPSSLGWIQAPSSYAYYVNNNYGTGSYPKNCQKLAEDVVDSLHNLGVDFSQYTDPNNPGYTTPIMIVHAGPGAEFTGKTTDIWSHSWSLYTPRTYNGVTITKYVTMPEYWQTVSATTSDMGIGVFCHEMGHGFWNLPDLYDTTYASSGIGNFSLMAGGSWGGPLGLGDSPAWPDAWCRYKMGFVTPFTIRGKVKNQSIPQTANNPTAKTVFKLTSKKLGSQEYFLVENRQLLANYYDYIMPGGLNGLLIWHVDEAESGNTSHCTSTASCTCSTNHYLVALQQADGLMSLENTTSNRGDAGDPYPGSTTNRSWSHSTIPNSDSWYSCSDSRISITNISDSGAQMTADFQAPGIDLTSIMLLLFD
jgi:immune inhibitor A